jgi:uncharacterized protein (TIGR02001 family)
MKLSHGLAAVGLAFAAMTAQAEVTGTVTAVTDYNFRGISLSANDPALQGSLDYAHDSGFYAGAWASNIDYGDDVDGDVEVDVYAGWAGGAEDGIGWDVGLVYYTYPGSDDVKDYPELYAGLSYNAFEVKQWYTNDYSGTDLDALYTEGNASFELPANFGLSLHLGYNYGDAFEDVEYMDYSVGLTYTLGHFDLGLTYVDTDLDRGDALYSDDDVFKSEGRAIFSISTTFPWSAAEE